jgi:hypothetical protein
LNLLWSLYLILYLILYLVSFTIWPTSFFPFPFNSSPFLSFFSPSIISYFLSTFHCNSLLVSYYTSNVKIRATFRNIFKQLNSAIIYLFIPYWFVYFNFDISFSFFISSNGIIINTYHFENRFFTFLLKCCYIVKKSFICFLFLSLFLSFFRKV